MNFARRWGSSWTTFIQLLGQWSKSWRSYVISIIQANMITATTKFVARNGIDRPHISQSYHPDMTVPFFTLGELTIKLQFGRDVSKIWWKPLPYMAMDRLYTGGDISTLCSKSSSRHHDVWSCVCTVLTVVTQMKSPQVMIVTLSKRSLSKTNNLYVFMNFEWIKGWYKFRNNTFYTCM